MSSRPYLILVLAFLASTTLAATGDQMIQILVNGKPVTMSEASTTVLSHEVSVPVRQFAEMAGASVQWDGSSGTLTIVGPAAKGVMRIGSRIAWIKGTRVNLPYPPFFFGGQIFGPQLFFNEMFDQAWVWDPLTRQFNWIPIFPRYRGGLSTRPYVFVAPSRPVPQPGTAPSAEAEAAPVPATGIVVGEVVRTRPSRTDPKITVRTAEKTITYSVARDAIILRGQMGGQAIEVPLASIRPGDRVTMRFNDEKRVIAIRAQYQLIKGTVKSSAGDTVLLESGETVRLTSQTRIVLPGNISGDREDIRPGDRIAAAVSPISGRAYVVDVVPAAETTTVAREDDQIRLNTYGPLRAGDTLIVLFRASPGGQAWFTIPGMVANQPMTEVEPGLYDGRYVVKTGDVALRQPVKVTFVASGGETYTRLSSRPVTVQTVAGYLPRITSPRQGEEIGSPIQVRGYAQPGSQVRVIIEYRFLMQGVMPVEGVSAVEEVRANNDGQWVTPPMPAVAPTFEGDVAMRAFGEAFKGVYEFQEVFPVVYTITAVSLDRSGIERSSYTVEVVKKPGK